MARTVANMADLRCEAMPAAETIVLLSPLGSTDSPVAAFVRDRTAGVMGFTIRVANLGTARSHAAKRLGRERAVAARRYGQGFFLPPAAACGAWIEQTTVD